MRIPLFGVSLGWIGVVLAHTKSKNVAIIAYHLAQYAQQEDLAVNITIFEKSDHVGGRTLTVNPHDDPSSPIELGASIFVTANQILYNATQTFSLPLTSHNSGLASDITAIYDGEKFVYQTTQGQGWWWDVAKLWWKYGLSPYRAVKLARGSMAEFLKLYEEPWFPFVSLTQRVHELGLCKLTAITGEQLLEQSQINSDFAREIIQAATRVNYASNLAHIHGLETMVSFSTDSAVAVEGGNWKIFNSMIQHSNAVLYLNKPVTSITKALNHLKVAPKYTISTTEDYPLTFDNVIIASPWQFSDITAGPDVLHTKIDEVPYTKLHVTLFTSSSRLHPGFFGLKDGKKAPSNVYTTLGKTEESKSGAEGVGRTGFYSISTVKTITNPHTQQREFVYKIFSAEVLTREFLSELFGRDIREKLTWYYPFSFWSSPVELPRVTFQDGGVGDGVWYTSGIEGFISTMETSALMGMNVARLVVDEFRRTGHVVETVTETAAEAVTVFVEETATVFAGGDEL